MADGGIIYTKTIDSAVQDGLDNNLIINPKYAYQKKFIFGDDWEEIKLGIFFSWTNSVTLPEAAFTSGTFGSDYSSGTGSPDSFCWYGIIRDQPEKILPTESGANFLGIKYNTWRVNVYSDNTVNNYPFSSESESGSSVSFLTPSNTITAPGRIYHYFNAVSSTTRFASYWGLRIKKLSGGTGIELEQYRSLVNTGAVGNSITDISLINLISKIDGNDHALGSISETSGLSSSFLFPDSFFFYNGYADIRPRLHAIAVKKIS